MPFFNEVTGALAAKVTVDAFAYRKRSLGLFKTRLFPKLVLTDVVVEIYVKRVTPTAWRNQIERLDQFMQSEAVLFDGLELRLWDKGDAPFATYDLESVEIVKEVEPFLLLKLRSKVESVRLLFEQPTGFIVVQPNP